MKYLIEFMTLFLFCLFLYVALALNMSIITNIIAITLTIIIIGFFTLQNNLFEVLASLAFIFNWGVYLFVALTLPLNISVNGSVSILVPILASQALFLYLSRFNEFTNFFKKLYYFETVIFLCVLKAFFMIANVDNLDIILQLLGQVYILYIFLVVSNLAGKLLKSLHEKLFDERGLKNGSNN